MKDSIKIHLAKTEYTEIEIPNPSYWKNGFITNDGYVTFYIKAEDGIKTTVTINDYYDEYDEHHKVYRVEKEEWSMFTSDSFEWKESTKEDFLIALELIKKELSLLI